MLQKSENTQHVQEKEKYIYNICITKRYLHIFNFFKEAHKTVTLSS